MPKTPDELRRRCDAFFRSISRRNDQHPESACLPLLEDLLQYCGMSKGKWDALKEESEEFREVTEMAQQRFTAAIIREAVANPKIISLAVFLTKQKHYGGYTDKAETPAKENGTITVQLEGAAEPFD